MEMNEYMQAVRKNLLVVAVSTLIGVLLGWAGAATATKTYSSSSQIMFSMQGAETIADINSASAYTMAQMPTYQGLATSPVVMDPVAKKVGLSGWTDIDGSVTASVVEESVLLDVTAEADSPARAQAVAQGVADELVKRVAGSNAATGGVKMDPTVTAPANLPELPSAPNVPVFLLAGGCMGLLLGVLAAVVREALRSARPERVATAGS